MSDFAEHELRRDGYLGNRLYLWQPRVGYRAGMDPVLLAACVPATPGQAVLDLGCGAGAAALCLASRVSGLTIAGVEMQLAYANLARRNASEAGVQMDVFCANLTQMPAALRQRHFDHILANPPYYRSGAHSKASDHGRGIALGETGTALSEWIAVAARRLKPKGLLHVIQRVDRLPELLAACEGKLGSVEVLPVAPRKKRPAGLVLLRAQKGGRADFKLHAPLIMHKGKAHQRDGDGYRAEIEGIFRNSFALEWPARANGTSR